MLFSSAVSSEPGSWRCPSAAQDCPSRKICLIALPGDQFAIEGPVECGPGVGLTLRSDIPMAGDVPERITPAQGTGQARQRPVLDVFVRQVIGSLQLDPDREV